MDSWTNAAAREALDQKKWDAWAKRRAKETTNEQLVGYIYAPNSPALTVALQAELTKRLKGH